MVQQHDAPEVQEMLPQPGRLAIYARVGEAARLTQQPQTDQLVEIAEQLGYSREQLIVYEERGVSGKKPISERESLQQLLQTITNPPEGEERIRAILVTSEDRLFRDADRVQVNSFITICTEHGVMLLTDTFCYDFTNPAHVSLFRFRCEQSTLYIEREIQRRLLTGRTKKRETNGKKKEQKG